MVKKRGLNGMSFRSAVPPKALIIILVVVIVVGFVTIGLSLHHSEEIDLAATYGLANKQIEGEVGIKLIPPPHEEVIER